MVLSLLKDICRPHVIDIIMLLKRGCGMSVNELSAALRMSYMGIKQHCIFLEKKGYLDTWRRPKPAGGRPEKIYRLTEKMGPLFPKAAGELGLDVLRAAEVIYGPEAGERLLLGFFQQKGERYASELKGRTLVDRAQNMAKIRMSEGCISFCEYSAMQGLRLIEYHTPLLNLVGRYPTAMDMEAQMFGRVLQCVVERLDLSFENVTRIEFRLRSFNETTAQ
jgi:predicted ArsR family transcriptional regulator